MVMSPLTLADLKTERSLHLSYFLSVYLPLTFPLSDFHSSVCLLSVFAFMSICLSFPFYVYLSAYLIIISLSVFCLFFPL